MGNLIDLLGRSFSYLTVVERVPRRKPGDSAWICQCVCGKQVTVQSFRLRSGRIKSCGCKKSELLSASHVRHGHYAGNKSSPEMISWRSAIERCENPRNHSYARYGGKGIRVCEEWRNDFMAFFRDLGPRPVGSTLDRIDSSKGYEPGNCKWATPKQQSNHLKNNRFVLVRGERLTIRTAADRFALPYSSFRNQLYAHGRYVAASGELFTLLPR